MPNAEDLQAFLDFARSTAREAGAHTLKYFQTDAAQAEFKSDDTENTSSNTQAKTVKDSSKDKQSQSSVMCVFYINVNRV